MRMRLIAAGITIAGILSGCSSSGLSDALSLPGTSDQTTGSIARDLAPTPPNPTGGEAVALTEETFAPAAGAIEQNTQDATPTQVATVRPSPAPRAAPVTAPRRSSGNWNSLKIYPPRFSDAKPVNFGRLKPQHFAVHGVDVSRWQNDINWPKLRKQGANFAYIKATEGGDHLDPKFHENWREAANAGMPRGAYHFFYWCRVAEEQADWFIRNVPKEKGALPPVIDVEYNHQSRSCRKMPSKRVILKKMQVFMDKIERHYVQKPVIYTAPDFYEDNLQGQFKEYAFWLRSVAAHPKVRYPNREFAFWQYSGTGLSKNHSTRIDLNVFNGSEKGFKRWLNQNAR